MPWSITVCCISILLVLSRLCDRLLRATGTSLWGAFLFLFALCVCEILPPIPVSPLVIIKPYATFLLLLGSAVLLARASRTARIRALIGGIVLSLLALLILMLLPPEASPLLIGSLPMAIVAFLCGYTADATAVAIMLSSIIAELSYAFLELPYFELGTSDFLDAACISGFFALILCRIFAHSPLADRRRLVADRVSHLPR
ncbi:MAG: hypothetical protein IKK58_02360 [Clostridia bacterium]|nr:hypothetical protein [Clostridia bacterium]